ncbi:MFS transporter [Natronoarchaeum sp. GCM10025703]
METLLAESTDPTNLDVIANMPDGVGGTRPLSHAVNWWLAAMLGGDQWAADMVAAWLPVVATLALGIVVYKLAVVITADVRIGLASVVLLAVAPVHAVYTGVGFIEHRLHQYLWLGVTLLALAWLAMDIQTRIEAGERGQRGAVSGHLQTPMTWLVAGVLGLSLGITTHLWGGSALMFIPLAAYIGLRAVVDAREGISPTLANLPVLVGVGIGAAISVWLHTNWEWHAGFVAYTPVMVFAGALAVVVLGEAWRRWQLHSVGLVAIEGVLAGIGLYLFRRMRPEDWARSQERADDLFLREGYTESVSLFTFDYGVIFGPLIQLGVGFYLGMAVFALVAVLVYRQYEPGWLLLVVYTGFWLVLATIQVRFAAQLIVPLSVLGGVGFVYLLSAVELARPLTVFRDKETTGAVADGGRRSSISVPGGTKASYLLVIGVLVCGFGLIYVPSLTSQITYTDAEYEANQAIQEFEEGVDREYPENFVLNEWPRNRMQNYHVNGESSSYGYARSNYNGFVGGASPDESYADFGNRVGYVVVTDRGGSVAQGTTQDQLLGDLGAGEQGLAHYRLLAVDDDRTAAAFAMVPGATIEGEAGANESVTVATEVRVDGRTLEYERTVESDGEGRFGVTIPYAGEYTVADETVTVTEAAVVDGETVSMGE